MKRIGWVWAVAVGVALGGCSGPAGDGGLSSGPAEAQYDSYGYDLEAGEPGLLGEAAPAAGGFGDADEVVVVERPDGSRVAYGPDRIAALRAKLDGHPSGVALPLERTDVVGRVQLNVASVTLTQVFTNPYASKIEAVYVFPLPQDAAVSDFVMVIGERRIRGIVREREEARRIYEAARAQGYRASLLSQERPNVFTQSVANIEPGQRIDVETTWFQTLAWRDGAFEMVVPTVVGPRFVPPGTTGGVAAVPYGAEGTSGQPTEVAYLPPHLDSDHRIGIRLTLDTGLPLAAIESPTHPITVRREGTAHAEIALRDGDDVPNRDFVLRYRTAGDGLQGAVAVHRDPASGEGWFTMLLEPPAQVTDEPPQPREMVFVVDCSGSMSGEPLAACKRAIRRCIDRLGPDDTFQIIRFSDSASALGAAPLRATPDARRRALRYVDGLDATGGTMMERGIVAALAPPVEAGRRRIVAFMTDGYIGNETDILRAVHANVGDSRIFSVGVGSATNRYLLERMASLGRGVAAYLGLDDSAAEQVDALFRRLERPAVAELRIDWGGADVRDVEPARLPDLFVGRPLVVHGRVRGELPTRVRVSGRVGARPLTFDVPVGAAVDHPALARLWARARIRSLNDARSYVATPAELADEIRALALAYGLASDFTSFVAVDATAVTPGDHGTTVGVPVPTPRGVRYETAVGGG
ncbi:MAG: VWA domain-containing protein [Planctomycetes bacterium]|nr:VWA domain-containing protein [Planctomycetota bacterium]